MVIHGLGRDVQAIADPALLRPAASSLEDLHLARSSGRRDAPACVRARPARESGARPPRAGACAARPPPAARPADRGPPAPATLRGGVAVRQRAGVLLRTAELAPGRRGPPPVAAQLQRERRARPTPAARRGSPARRRQNVSSRGVPGVAMAERQVVDGARLGERRAPGRRPATRPPRAPSAPAPGAAASPSARPARAPRRAPRRRPDRPARAQAPERHQRHDPADRRDVAGLGDRAGAPRPPRPAPLVHAR